MSFFGLFFGTLWFTLDKFLRLPKRFHDLELEIEPFFA